MSVTVVDPRKRTPLSDRIFATRSPTSSPNRRCSGTGSAATIAVGTPRLARQAAASQPISPLPKTLAGNVDVVDGDAANQLDVVTDEPAGAVQIELGLAGAQECGGACCGTSRQRSTLPDRCRWR